MATDNVHKNHRSRVRKKFLDNGLDNFEMHESLEFLLFYCVPYKNTSELAHRLLDEFGSLSAVFDAPFNALCQFGLTETQAAYLKLMPEISRLYIDDKHNNRDKVFNYKTAGQSILNKFIGRENENVLLLLLDAKGKELYCGIVSKGSINDTTLPIRKIVDFAMRYNSKFAIIAHNHPSGIALPSKEDINATINVKNALNLIGVRLIDHFIVADNDYVSLAQSNLSGDLFDSF
ncbi:MAG: RadC family protein [Ruminococcus sp.]|nr:RadC family protein [Ruminococcus sp.]MBQ7134611.1 RadC family protein [Ruminococcus sp.]